MLKIVRYTVASFLTLTGISNAAFAAELIFPANRTAYYAHQPIELAVAGLENGETVALTLTTEGAAPVELSVTGDGSTRLLELPPNALAPGNYTIKLGDKNAGSLSVSRGVWPSEMYVSQTGAGYKNFVISNAFNFGVEDSEGLPAEDIRNGKSTLGRYEGVVKQDIPAFIYMYWTGFVLHKPWGIHKEWAAEDQIENMRLFNYHVAQRMRRFNHLLFSIGSLDEPGLPWGKTAAGGSASGFTGWNVADWMAERGFEWTDDPGSLSDEDFRTYMRLRALMLREAFQQANDDIKEVWPESVYATDSYAPQAVGDGTDPMNQVANDIPTTHVFADYGIGKLGVLAGMYLEKAHDPLSKIAHAMNGQLFGERVPQPQTRYAYHLMQNVMLASGLDSNWWLNHTGMTPEDLEAVNEPSARIGSIFDHVEPREHDIAVLWSNTEIWMRVKGLMKAEASNADGEQIALMIADMPEDAVDENGKLKYNAYSVGGNYKGEILTTFMAINRAGFASHILHEDRLLDGALDDYKVLVITHQTHELPAERRAVIENWVAKGGTLIVDTSSTVPFDGALSVDAPSVVNQGYAWTKDFGRLTASDRDVNKTREDSYVKTNHFMESFSRDAAPAYGKVLADAGAVQIMKTDSVQLACERHVGGDLQLLMVINGYEDIPEIAETEAHHIWNYAPYTTSYSLPTIAASDSVYLIEGLDWKTVSKVQNPTEVQQASFEPGEMKLYLVVPNAPGTLDLAATLNDGLLKVEASLAELKSPWPLEITVTDPSGTKVVDIYRSMREDGTYAEDIPLGMNAPDGTYTVSVSSPVAGLSKEVSVAKATANIAATSLDETVRMIDQETIKNFLGEKPELVIAVGSDAHQAAAEKLAKGLKAAGLTVSVKPSESIWEKAMYPRVWDPYVNVRTPTDKDRPLPEVTKLDEKNRPVRDEDNKPVKVPGTVVRELNITSDYYETPTITTPDGEAYTGNWRAAGTMLTVVGDGFVQIGGIEQFVEPGVKIFMGDRNRQFFVNDEVTQTKTTDEFRRTWERPWKRIVGHVGGNNLTPQLPEVYRAPDHLILLGDSTNGGTLVRALQASELLLQIVDVKYPGPGKALIQYAWSPFALEKNVIYIGASDVEGINAGTDALLDLVD